MEQSQNTTANQSKKSVAVKAAVIAAIAVAVTAVIMLIYAATLPKDKIVNGVFAEQIDVSGMTLDEATAAIEAADIFKGITFTVNSGGKSRQIGADDISLSVDAAATAQKAFDICKSGNKLSDVFKSIAVRFAKEDIAPVPTADTEKLDLLLYELGKEINGELIEHIIDIGDTTATITPGSEGQNPDVSAVREAVLSALAEGDTNISVKFDTQKPQKFNAQTLIDAVHRDAQNAKYVLENGKAAVKPHVIGTDADPSHAEEAAKKVNSGNVAEITITHTAPEITTDMLKAKMYTGTLASYSTRYSTSAVNRSKNVELAARRINGTVLLPGDVFSYNNVVGTRTISNGFYNAPVYENGKSVDGVGGGVCQVSTTLYSAVLYADLEIVKRQNHSLTVGYVPLGQDATVVDGAIDFQFKNNTTTPVRIDSYASGGTIKITLVGTPVSGKSVKITHETIDTVEPTEKITNDSSLPSGTRTVTSKGKTGYTVRSTKIVYQNGNEVSRKSLGNSKYKMVPTEVTVGTGAAAAVSAPTTAVTEPAPAATSAPTEPPTTAQPTQTQAESRPTPNPVEDTAEQAE